MSTSETPTDQSPTRPDPWIQNPKIEPPAPGSEQWAKELVTKLATDALVEKRRARRWGIFFKSLVMLYLIALLWIGLGGTEWLSDLGQERQHTAIVNLTGSITDDGESNADNLVAGLRAAFKDEQTAGVILRINSPGGSPVQAGLVFEEIMRLRDQHPTVPLYAVITDVGASGAYYIAAAAQDIYASPASLIGSIGVVAGGFGFVDTLEKLGIERRLYTAGDNKALLDPFSPEDSQQAAFFQALLDQVHQQFISAVQRGRGERLQDDPELFSGLVWTGERSVELGLIDGLGSTRYVAEEVIGEERLVDFTRRLQWTDRLLLQIGQGIGVGVLEQGQWRLQ
jgi:protease-4